VWLASRYLQISATSVYFSIRSNSRNGDVYFNGMFRESSDGSLESNKVTRGMRPVVILKSGLEITGEGTRKSLED